MCISPGAQSIYSCEKRKKVWWSDYVGINERLKNLYCCRVVSCTFSLEGLKKGSKKCLYSCIERNGKYVVDITPSRVLWLVMTTTATFACTGGQTVTFLRVKFDPLFMLREEWIKLVAFETLGPGVDGNNNDSNFCLYVGQDSSPKVTTPLPKLCFSYKKRHGKNQLRITNYIE